ncbi:MAG: hypothetical protein SV775_20020, partial [Thermodesulfobacteriota bacterium]|nr:hypothetical protein [Thermodesulfobacteriota bacterium]
FADACLSEGLGYLYGLHFQTGTSHFEAVFTDYNTETITDGVDEDGNVIESVELGRGLATTPNLHVGEAEGTKAFVQTSTGAIVEIPQENLPISNYKTGRKSWVEMKD